MKYCQLKDIDVPLKTFSRLCENCFWSKYKEYIKTFAIVLGLFVPVDCFLALLFVYGNFNSATERTIFVVLLLIPGGVTLLLLISIGLILNRQSRKTPGPWMRSTIFLSFIFRRIEAAVNVIRSALSDVRAREYSPHHLEITHMNLILDPDNWDLRPRNKILGQAVAKFYEAIRSSGENREAIEDQLSDISLTAIREAEDIINRHALVGVGEIRGTLPDPGFSCSLSDVTRDRLSQLL